jgi:magnesium-transporting ATPase (P-type)
VLAAARAATRRTEIGVDDLVDLEFLGLWGILDPPRPKRSTPSRTATPPASARR